MLSSRELFGSTRCTWAVKRQVHVDLGYTTACTAGTTNYVSRPLSLASCM